MSCEDRDIMMIALVTEIPYRDVAIFGHHQHIADVAYMMSVLCIFPSLSQRIPLIKGINEGIIGRLIKE